MSDAEISVADAFDDLPSLLSLEVELTPRQLDWLQTQADERGLSLDHVVRSIITAQIANQTDDLSAPGATPRSPSSSSTESNDRDANPSPGEDAPNLMQSLRSAHRRLQDLTAEQTVGTATFREARAQLQAQLDRTASDSNDSTSEEGDTTGGAAEHQTSMFDLMESE